MRPKQLKWSGSREAVRQYEEACAKLPPVKPKKKQKKSKRREFIPPTKQPFIPYAEYLHTPWWRQKRQQKMESVGSRCERCGAEKRLQVHHLNYDRLGREKHSDLQVLCKACHEKEHEGCIAAKSHLDAIAKTE